MKLKTQTDESIIHVQEQTGEMQSHRQKLFLLVYSSDANQQLRSYSSSIVVGGLRPLFQTELSTQNYQQKSN